MSESHAQSGAVRSAARSSDLKRRLILDGARQVFLRGGFAGSSMDEIAVEAGVSKGTLYHHFEGKEALFRALVAREATRIARSLPRIDETEPDAGLALRRLAVSVMEVSEAPDTLAVFRLIIGAHGSFPTMGEDFLRAALCDLVERIVAYLDGCRDKYAAPAADPEGAALRFALRCLSHGVGRILVGNDAWMAFEREGDAARLVDSIVPARGGRWPSSLSEGTGPPH